MLNFILEIRANLLRSRIARVIVFKITQRVEDVLSPILMDNWSQRVSEGVCYSDLLYCFASFMIPITVSTV